MRAEELLLAAYLGGAVCYAGIMLVPEGRGRQAVDFATWAAWTFLLALAWPASIALMHEWAARQNERGRS